MQHVYRIPGRLPGALLGLLFPAHCRLCGEWVRHARRIPVCDACLEGLPAAGAGCPRCGKAWEGAAEAGVCLGCIASAPDYDSARSGATYAGAGRELIHLMKYSRVRPLAGFWAERLEPCARGIDPPPEALVAIPLTPARLRQRGFNPSADIACRLAQRLGRPFLAQALRRPREAAPQAGLDRAARERNVRGAFRATHAVDGRRILLVDDVLTTGATAAAAAHALKRAGAVGVDVLTAARADLHAAGGPAALEESAAV